MRLLACLSIFAALSSVFFLTGFSPGSATASDPPDLDAAATALMQSVNDRLGAQGLDLRIGSIDLFTIGIGRPANRIHQEFFRWVPGDLRRRADGDNITYLVRQQFAQVGDLTPADATPAIQRAFNAWQADVCVSNTTVVQRPDATVDPDVFDELVGQGDTGFPNFNNIFQADIVEAGFRPRAFFDVFGPGAGDFILGITVTFFFRTDINNDGYFDTAFAETYFNSNFQWAIDLGLPSIDVESVALHESGHALGLGHFGPPPEAVMNPFYSGPRQSPLPPDHAGMCTVWAAWPQR